MLSCLNPQKLCQIRFGSFTVFSKCLKRNSKKSSWSSPIKKQEEIMVSDTVSSNVGFKSLIKPFIFTVSFSGCCFVAASIWQYENMRSRAHQLFKKSQFFSSFSPAYKRLEIRNHINTWWNSQTEGQKIASALIGMNLFVFLLWRLPPFYPLMRKYFCASPAMNATCLPMILSTFSHYSFFHLAANMYVLYSFSSSAVAFFGKEQFVAFYASSAVVSSFVSYVHKVVSGRFVTSLGASGALMAILSSICFQFPNAQLAIVFLPFFTFSASMAIKCVMAIDVVGLFAKWKLFDHAAHLGGAMFGVLYLYFGREYVWNQRGYIFQWYHKIREKSDS